MYDPHDHENRPYLSALSRRRKIAFLSLTLETLAASLWRIVFWCVFFAGLWMLGLPSFFGGLIHKLSSIVFAIGLLYFIWKDIGSFRFPRREAIDKALERASHFPLGLINSLQDTLANPKKPVTRTLWHKSQTQLVRTLKRLRAPSPKARLIQADPHALRFIAMIIFAAGLMVSGSQWSQKIMHGAFPVTPSFVLSQGRSTNLWITPPSYTQMPQMQLSGNGTLEEPIDIPEGSKIRIRLHSVLGQYIPPHFYMDDNRIDLTYFGDGLFGTETQITKGDQLSVTQALFPRARWDYHYIIDQPPEIRLDHNENDAAVTPENDSLQNAPAKENSQPPKKESQSEQDKKEAFEVLDKGQIRFPLVVKDDYGVKEVRMTMTLDDVVQYKPLGDPVTETRLVMSAPETDFKISPVYDMTWHTWAGLPVTFTYEAIDHKGQVSTAGPISVVLPERTFEHPMAQSLIEMRTRLAWDYDQSFSEIAENLETLLQAPDYFQHNPVVYLAIRTASSRLYYTNNAKPSEREQAAKAVIALLWDTAITIEEGNLSLAMRELRNAQRALENAMRDPDATEDEISRLMDELREKMNNYFMEMQREMQKRRQAGEDLPRFSPDQFSQMISPDSLSKMMQQIESALREGDEQKAQELMSKLQRMMEMLDPSMTPQLPQDMQAMQKGINELQQLIDRQKELLEQTEKQAQALNRRNLRDTIPQQPRQSLKEMLQDLGIDDMPPLPAPDDALPMKKNKSAESQNSDFEDEPANTEDNKTEQEALRYILGQLMLEVSEKTGEIPDAMGAAEQEMRGSENALGENKPVQAIPHQEQAIEYLQQSQEQLSQKFRARMQQMIGIGLSGTGQRYDPLGRPYGGEEDPNGSPHGSEVKVPDEAQKKRVDEILKTLRDRSGDRSRPEEELDYFRRLLRQF